MPRNGYWIECIPLSEDTQEQVPLKGQNGDGGLYKASSQSFPDMDETAPSPDKAIEKLRDRLKLIRQQYDQSGKLLPEMDNPVRPPTRLRRIQGWISVYVEVGTCLGKVMPGKMGAVNSALLVNSLSLCILPATLAL